MWRSCRVQGVLFLLACIPSAAHAFQAADVEQASLPGQFFAPYETNSFMFRSSRNDDPASEINVSVRYFFRSQTSPDGRANLLGFNPFFSYTGKYDFYWWPLRDTRPSGPVISRYQNPALHFRYQLPDTAYSRSGDWTDVGFEHISNGQALTASSNRAAVLNAYQSNDHALMDSISRVGGTLALTLEGRKLLGSRSDLSIKWYVYRSSQEADVFWGSFANRNVDFNDFQRIKVQWRIKYDGLGLTELPWQFCAEMSVGRLGLSEDSWNFMLNMPVRMFGDYELPFAITAHRGPLNTLSDYTRPQNTLAAGFIFAY